MSIINIPNAIGVINGLNECANLFQWVTSAISSVKSQWGRTDKELLEENVRKLLRDFQRLLDTLPAKYDLIDRAEWRIHEKRVADLLPRLKDAAYDAEDLIDEFRRYELNVQIEGKATSEEPDIDFIRNFIQGSFNRVVDIQERLNNLSNQLENICLQAAPRFDRSVRPETTCFPTESRIFGRDEELIELIGLLGVNTKRKREEKIGRVPVLPIVGIGGVGKTTLAQSVSNHPNVNSHFDQIIWICVSDEFDVKRLTKEALEQAYSQRETNIDNLNFLQGALSNSVNNKRILLVLDDVWDNALKDNGQYWNRFCAPFTNALQGSMMLVTTRSQNLAERVCTLDPFPLDGLKDEIFWDFFIQCIFGYQNFNIDPKLKDIAREILPKLKGSPLAAKTLGRLLALSLDTPHWETVLRSELWELRQEETDILPALRLSYIYLPLHLKRCFAFCAVYPKDHVFMKQDLAEIWAAEGFVQPQGHIPHHVIGCQYFDDLVNRSFFQMVDSNFVIHDLMHDMAQLVSKDECFILKNTSDFSQVHPNVRHLSILPNRDINCSNLLSLCKHSKLRTLICRKSFMNSKASESAIDNWCTELPYMRVIVVESTRVLPNSINNMKLLRYIKISRKCPLKAVPSNLCYLKNLQAFYASKCTFESLPSDFSKLINLHSFEVQQLGCPRKHEIEVKLSSDEGQGKQITLIKNVNQFSHLIIRGLDAVSKDHASEANLRNKEKLDSLTLEWSPRRESPGHDEIEILEVLCPPINIKSLTLENYLGEGLPSWFHPQQLPKLTSVSFIGLNGLKKLAVLDGISVVPYHNSGSIFSCLADLTIMYCANLLSLEEILKPDYVPAIKKISIAYCKNLESLSTEKEICSLEELSVSGCPNINSTLLSLPSLKKLSLRREYGKLVDNIECHSITYLSVSPNRKSPGLCLPAVETISGAISSLRSFSSLTHIRVHYGGILRSLDGLLRHEYFPSIKTIVISNCLYLRSPGERLGSFTCLRSLHIEFCPIIWQGVVLPLSLQRLFLWSCGDISGWFPSCLENLTSLKSLGLSFCDRIESIPDHLWDSNLASLQELYINCCHDLVSIGGPKVIANIKRLLIDGCKKLTELPRQPVMRGKLIGQSNGAFRESFCEAEQKSPVQVYETGN